MGMFDWINDITNAEKERTRWEGNFEVVPGYLYDSFVPNHKRDYQSFYLFAEVHGGAALGNLDLAKDGWGQLPTGQAMLVKEIEVKSWKYQMDYSSLCFTLDIANKQYFKCPLGAIINSPEERLQLPEPHVVIYNSGFRLRVDQGFCPVDNRIYVALRGQLMRPLV